MSPVRVFEVGERYGSLTVVTRRDTATATVSCRCDCGAEVTPRVSNLSAGLSTSCGCSRSSEGNHRWNGNPESHELYSTWKNMKQRCLNPHNTRYADYGGRGITVCDEWAGDFWSFATYMGQRPEGCTLDRVDNDGDYEPGNVRWATSSEQAANQRPRRSKTHCTRDHEFTPENTRINRRGDRVCLACVRERARGYRQVATA